MDGMLIGVTLLSLGLAAAMTFVAWRTVREERPQTDAPAATKAALENTPFRAASSNVFEPPRQEALGTASATALLLVAALSGGSAAAFLMNRIDVDQTSATLSATASTTPSLELLSLDHVRAADKLTVRGEVANRRSGPAIGPLVAVVQFLDGADRVVRTQRTAVDGLLTPGDSASFAVTVPGRGLERYHVSFEAAGRPVAHLDVRDSGVMSARGE